MIDRLQQAGALARITRADGTLWLIGGSLVAGVASYGFQLVGGRSLGAVDFAPIATLWSVQYVVTAIVLLAIEQFEVRTVAAAGGDRRALTSYWRPLWIIVAGFAVAVTIFLVMVADRALLSLTDLALVGGLWVASMGGLAMARGVAGGRADYQVAGVATGSDALFRLLLAIPMLIVFATTRSLAWVLPIGPLPFLAWWWLRGRLRQRSDFSNRRGLLVAQDENVRAGRFIGAAAFANGSLQVLLAVGPVLLVLMGELPAHVSAFFITTTISRAPMLFGIGLVPRLLAPLTHWAEAGDYAHVRRAVWPVVAITLMLASVAGAAAFVVGPTVVGWLYGSEFAVSALVTGATVAAVVVALGALALDQVLAAENRPQALVGPWAVALVTAIGVVVVLPAEPIVRVSIAVLAGQIVALCGLGMAIVFGGRS